MEGKPLCAFYYEPSVEWLSANREGDEDPSYVMRVPVILIAWANGRIVWSQDMDRGGPPYFEGVVPKEKIKKFLQTVDCKGYFESVGSHSSYFGPDASFHTMAISTGDKTLQISSWHRAYGKGDSIATSHGIESLGRRNREEVLAQQPEKFRLFLKTWQEIEDLMVRLVPEKGAPLGNTTFVLEDFEALRTDGTLDWR
jgi:hypothetical protein